MRKAFDANVPKLRPRLKSTVVEAGTPPGEEAATVDATADAADPAPLPDPLPASRGEGDEDPTASATPTVEPSIPFALSVGREAVASDAVDAAEVEGRTRAAQSTLEFTESPDVASRRERLLKVKRKVAAAARAAPPMPALPETSARAGESALALVRDLEGELSRAREVEVALRADLDQARAELARGVADGRRAVERLAAVEKQVEEKRAVLEEMLSEMSALEEERDGAVGRAQALAALDEERQALLDGLSTRAEQAEKARAEAEAEVGRLGAELDERAADAARLRAGLAQVTRERDDLGRELAEARRELAELADARKALEQVHEALATARARLG
jgi:DNA repair exonuclease SbcCD ATPase subunit